MKTTSEKTRKMKSKTAFLAFFFLFSIFFQAAFAQNSNDSEIISLEKNIFPEETLRGLGLDLLFEWEGKVYVLVQPEDLRVLKNLSLPFVFESHRFPALRNPQFGLQSSLNGEYHSYKELEADLNSLQSAYPQLAKVMAVGESLENRKIYALKISDNVSQDENEAEVLFLGCHHAREWISVEVPFLLGRHLLENYETDANIRRLVNQSEVWIVPLVNPDGLEYTIHYYRYWRKNRRFNEDGSFGVDINRNYSYQWGYDNEGSSGVPSSEVYRGSAPFSEPETQAVRDLVEGKNFRAMITYHSYSQVILYPWGYTEMPSSKDQLLREIAASMSQLMQPVNGRIYDYGEAGTLLYVTNGDTTDWTFGVFGMPSYTIELPPIDELEGGFFNPEQDIRAIFSENLPAALYLIDWSIQNSGGSEKPALRNKNRSHLINRSRFERQK